MNRDALQKTVLRDIKSRYILAISLVAFFLIAGYGYNRWLNHGIIEDFNIINKSGRQRALSQKIALFANTDKHQELEIALHEFTTALNFLKASRFVKPQYPDVLAIYKVINTKSEKFVRIALTTPLTTLEKEEIFHLSQEIFHEFDKVTLLTQKISESEFSQKSYLELVIFVLTLFILTMEIIFIFNPMAKKIKTTFFQLNNVEDKALANARLSMIGEIASTIGHEIKNPLSVILAYTEIKNKITGNLEAEFNKKIEKIAANAKRIKKIIEAMSVQARESSQDVMTPALLGNIIDDAIDIFESKILIASITLVRKENFVGEVICRPAAISQVVANLLANAIDALSDLPQGNKTIEIETGMENNEVYLRITDSGLGVPKELIDKIFESFVTTKTIGKGTGLGLAISRKIMNEHGGEIKLRPEISNSCFEIRFNSRQVINLAS